jgi:hypothetical protein
VVPPRACSRLQAHDNTLLTLRPLLSLAPPANLQPPPTYNEWNENEDMVAFFLDTVQAQVRPPRGLKQRQRSARVHIPCV